MRVGQQWQKARGHAAFCAARMPAHPQQQQQWQITANYHMMQPEKQASSPRKAGRTTRSIGAAASKSGGGGGGGGTPRASDQHVVAFNVVGTIAPMSCCSAGSPRHQGSAGELQSRAVRLPRRVDRN